MVVVLTLPENKALRKQIYLKENKDATFHTDEEIEEIMLSRGYDRKFSALDQKGLLTVMLGGAGVLIAGFGYIYSSR